MNYLDVDVEEIDRIYGIANKDERMIANIILMEKEARGLSYTDLAKMLNHTDSIYKEMYAGVLPTMSEKIRQVLNNNIPDRKLLQELCEVLNIQDSLPQRIAADRYEKSPEVSSNENNKHRGRISNKQKLKNREVCEEVKRETTLDNVPPEKSILLEAAVINGVNIISYEDEGIEPDLYYALLEERQKEEVLKKTLLLFEDNPKQVKAFLDQFEPDEETLEQMERIKIKVIR